MNALIKWLFQLLLHDLAAYCGYAPIKTQGVDVAKEQVKIEPTIQQVGGNVSGGGPQAENAHGPR